MTEILTKPNTRQLGVAAKWMRRHRALWPVLQNGARDWSIHIGGGAGPCGAFVASDREQTLQPPFDLLSRVRPLQLAATSLAAVNL
jgi:hypothetical protein